ncbi:hypothetical protein [Zoogloea sp.]|uniref:hypothetical protein n=1 Tax=Zoogloea sp. TaxID=49181 RepID=UPI0014168158|nr:MAG: hypothetical protein F9K15_19550 [Zoogloea sp.]
MTASLPPLRNHLLHPSGGLVYHLRALRHRHGLWAGFHHTVAGWLNSWQPRRRQLVLVGPNAGHALPAGFLARFDEVVALEPDPLARGWLARRPDAGRLRFVALDCLAGPEGLALLAAAFPEAAILFSNVLGQVPAPGGSWSDLLRRQLEMLPWASYHDVASTERAPQCTTPITLDGGDDLDATLARFWHGGRLTVNDHETFQLGGQGPFSYVPWQIIPGRWQLVEWTCRDGQPRPEAQA